MRIWRAAPRRNENEGKSQQIEGVYIPGDRKINSARRLKTCFLVSAQSSLVQKKIIFEEVEAMRARQKKVTAQHRSKKGIHAQPILPLALACPFTSKTS